MAFSRELKTRLTDAGFSENQIRALEIVFDRTGVSENAGTTTGEMVTGNVELAEENLKLEKEKFEVLKQQHTIQREMGTHIQDQSMMIDRMNDMREERIEYAAKEAEFAQTELEIALNRSKLDMDEIDAAKKKVIETQKQIKAIKQAAKMQESMIDGAEKFANLMGVTGGGGAAGALGKMVEGFDVNAVNIKEMGKSMGAFGAKVLSTISPMRIMTTLTDQAIETFMRFDKAQFEIFEQTGIMTAADDMAMMAAETDSFTNGGQEMKNTIVGLQQSFSELSSVTGVARKELMTTALVFEGIGVSAATSGEAMATMIQTLGQTPQIAAENALKFSALADELGRPPAEIVEGFNQMAGELAKHGPAMQQQFMKLQAVASRTGMSVQSLVDTTTKFDTFEEGAGQVGMLNAVLGGPYLDTLTMMSGTTTERLLELKGAFDAAGEDFASMSQFRRQALAEQMGMGVDELGKFMKLSESEMKAEMARTEALAASREEIDNRRMKLMDLMSKIAAELQKAMEEVFGTEMFDQGSLDTVKGVFVSILKVVKAIAGAIGMVNDVFSKFTGGKGAMSGILTLGAVAGVTIGGKMGFNFLKKKGLGALLKRNPKVADILKTTGLDKTLGLDPGAKDFLNGVQRVHIVGSDISLGGGGFGGGGRAGDGMLDQLNSQSKGRGGTGRSPRSRGFRAPTGQAGRFGMQVDRATRMKTGVGKFQGPGRMASAARGLTGRGLGGARSAMSVIGSGTGSGLGAKLLAGLGMIAGPLMSVISGYKEVTSAADLERERAMMGGQPNALKLGRMTATAVAHPLANIALQFIPGFGTALSLIDGVLSMFGMSPVKWLIKNLMDILPDAFFPALGRMVIGQEHFSAQSPAFANDAIITTPTRFNASDTAEVVAAKEGGVLAKKLDKLISLMSEGGNGNREIVIKIDRKEIARAAINGINKDFYGQDVASIGAG